MVICRQQLADVAGRCPMTVSTLFFAQVSCLEEKLSKQKGLGVQLSKQKGQVREELERRKSSGLR